jgi:hypothetical protein
MAARQGAERGRGSGAGDGRGEAGEKIVALGAHLLHEGEAVRLAEQPMLRTGENHERKTLQSVSARCASARSRCF